MLGVSLLAWPTRKELGIGTGVDCGGMDMWNERLEKGCSVIVLDMPAPVGRPKKTWLNTVSVDKCLLGMMLGMPLIV